MKERWIGLLDCNNFFVSCERLFRPDLKNVPVAVLSSNDGCIVARSQEVKDMHVPMGVPYFQVKDIMESSNVTLFSGNHRLYRDVSKRVFKCLKDEIPEMEQYSVDEAFFPFSGSAEEVEIAAKRVKDTIERLVGIPVSIGVSKTKTLAKVANAVAKKAKGVHVLTLNEWAETQKELNIEQIWGVGAGFSRRLREHKITTAHEYITADPNRIKELFGVVGQRLQSELTGKPAYGKSEKPKQSIMSSRSFSEETTDKQVLKEAVAYHVESIAYELRQIGHKAKVMAVYIAPSRHGDFALQNSSAEVVFEVGKSSTSELTKAALALLDGIYKEDVPYKKAGVRVAALESNEESQLRLFKDGSDASDETDPLQDAIDTIHRRYKTGRLHLGRLEGVALYQGKGEKRSPCYTTEWNDLKAVKAN